MIELQGDYDTPTGYSTQFDGPVYNISKAPGSNRIIVTGDFTTFNNESIRSKSRLGKRETIILNYINSWLLDRSFLINSEGDFSKAITVDFDRSNYGEGGTQSILLIGRISSVDDEPVNGLAMLNVGDSYANYAFVGGKLETSNYLSKKSIKINEL